MLIGNQPARIDDKGRLKVPTLFRDFLQEKYGSLFYVTSVEVKSALIYPMPVWLEKVAKLQGAPQMEPAMQKYLRITSLFGAPAEMDAQGRLLIPQHLRDRAQVIGDVAVLGHTTFIEAVNEARALAEVTESPFSVDDAKALAGFGF